MNDFLITYSIVVSVIGLFSSYMLIVAGKRGMHLEDELEAAYKKLSQMKEVVENYELRQLRNDIEKQENRNQSPNQ